MGKREVKMIITAMFVITATVIAQERKMEPFERPDPVEKVVVFKTVDTSDKGLKERAKIIAACLAGGGVPVPVAGVLSSDGVDCAEPSDDDPETPNEGGWQRR